VDIEEESAFYRALRKFKRPSVFHCHPSQAFTYTDGVKFLADTLQAHWLIDVIARLQPVALSFSDLARFQLWEFFPRDGKDALLFCSRAAFRPVFKQVLPAVSFPVSYIRLYLRGGVLMLPSER
jgi:hypothetical protein